MKRVQKPIRLYVLAIFIVVAYGFMPLVSVFPFTGSFLLVGPIILPFNGSIQVLYDSKGEVSFVLVFVSLFLSIFSAASALVAFLGIMEGRLAALAFVTLDLLWWTFLLVMMMIGSESPGSSVLRLSIEILIPPFWLAFVWWNFKRPDITEYYKYQSQVQR